MVRLLRITVAAAVCLTLLGLLVAPTGALAANLAYAEYFIDSEPGQGHGTSIQPCDGAFDEAQEEFCVASITVPGIADGQHTFYLRLRDTDNRWGMRQMIFYKVSSSPYAAKHLTAAEYFIDHDPGLGGGTSVPPADILFDEATELLVKNAVSTGSLTPGSHTLSVRVRDSYNVWGVARSTMFRVVNPYRVDSAYYYLDNDSTNVRPLTCIDSSLSPLEIVVQGSATTCMMVVGEHRVTARIHDSYFNTWPADTAQLTVVARTTPCCAGTVGNIDDDEGDLVDIADLMALVDYLFLEYQGACCFEEWDLDQNGTVDIADLQVLVDYLFFGSALLSCPG